MKSFFDTLGLKIKLKFKDDKLETIDKKDHQDFVTNVDFNLQKLIIDEIQSVFPKSQIITEESKINTNDYSNNYFIVDPLDGTLNFLHDYGTYCVSIAYACNNKIKFGYVYNLITNDSYYAEKYCGAFKNGERIQPTSGNSSIILISTGLVDYFSKNDECRRILRKLGKFRISGSQAMNLCYTAERKALMCLSLESRIWDDAAGSLICQEAGLDYIIIQEPGKEYFGSIAGEKNLIRKIKQQLIR